MKKINGYGWIIQFVTFMIALVYFTFFYQVQIRNEAMRCAEEAIYKYENSQQEEQISLNIKMDRIEYNLKRLMSDQGVDYIEIK